VVAGIITDRRRVIQARCRGAAFHAQGKQGKEKPGMTRKRNPARWNWRRAFPAIIPEITASRLRDQRLRRRPLVVVSIVLFLLNSLQRRILQGVAGLDEPRRRWPRSGR
jgi:hypothetical protein